MTEISFFRKLIFRLLKINLKLVLWNTWILRSHSVTQSANIHQVVLEVVQLAPEKIRSWILSVYKILVKFSAKFFGILIEKFQFSAKLRRVLEHCFKYRHSTINFIDFAADFDSTDKALWRMMECDTKDHYLFIFDQITPA